MTGHLFVHLGPPKTATTSIQLALQSVDFQGFHYLGVHQPRDPNKTGPSSLIYTYCLDQTSAITAELRYLLSKIRDWLNRGDIIVLSEEMFTVWQEKAHFWEKLERLEHLLVEFPHSYVVTIRDPKEALPSYYQELYAGLPAIQKLRPALFFEHSRCDCYDYRKLTSWFEERGHSLILLDFDSLRSGTVNLREMLGKNCTVDLTIAIPKANEGKKGEKKDSRIHAAVTLSDFSRHGLLRKLKDRLRDVAPRAFEHIRRLANQTTVRSQTERRVRIPGNRLANLSEAYNATRMKLLSHRDNDTT